MRPHFLFLFLFLSLPAPTASAHAFQQTDTLQLGRLRAAAAQQDPRSVQPDLIARASELRIAALRAERLPQLRFSAQGSVQNEVPEIPIRLPDGDIPRPPREQFRAQLEAEWMLYDGSRTSSRAAAEHARRAEEVAGVSVTLFALREATTEAFFGAILSDARARTLVLALDDIDARLQIVRRRVDEGTALPADAAALEAERIRVQQEVDEAGAARRAALDVLTDLTGVSVSPSSILALPDLDPDVRRTLQILEADMIAPESEDVHSELRRPELNRFRLAAERAEAEARVREAQSRPSLSLFGQAGLGRPSPFNFLSDDLSEYGLAGVRLRWSIVDWGSVRREAAAIRVQGRLAETEAAAFVRRLLRDVEDDTATISRLEGAIVQDERIVVLREEALRAARSQLEEGVLLLDTYTDRLTDLADARLALERHRIERVRTQARLLSDLGRYPESRLLSSKEAESTNHLE